MASCNSWQYLVTILAKIFPRSWHDLAKIVLRYPWRVDPGIANYNSRMTTNSDVAHFLLMSENTIYIVQFPNQIENFDVQYRKIFVYWQFF